MRHVPFDALPEPAGLSKQRHGKTELELAREHYKDPFDPKSGSYDFAAYKEGDVKERLEALFHGKCAYCETVYASSAPVDIEHYRPKGAVEGDDKHLGYWWLAMAWSNLLPSCIDCNRRRKQVLPAETTSLVKLDARTRTFSASHVALAGKKDLFPIEGTRAYHESDATTGERALLIHPRESDPGVDLMFHVDPLSLIGLALPKPLMGAPPPGADPDAPHVSRRGAVSIQVYGLNRLGLVQERTRILRRLGFLESMSVEIAWITQELEGHADEKVKAAGRRLTLLREQLLDEMKAMGADDAPHSAMVKAWIGGFILRLKNPPAPPPADDAP